MQLDLATLFLIFLLIDVLMLCMFAFASSSTTSTANRLWSAGLFLHLTALLLIMLRGNASPVLTYVLPNVLLSASFAIMTKSLAILLNFRIGNRWIWLPIPVMLACASLLMDELPWLLTFTGFMYALQFSVMLYMLGARWYVIHSGGRYFMAVSMFAVIGAFYFRSSWVLTHEVSEIMIHNGDIMLSLPYLVGIIATVGLSGGMLIVLRDRLGEQLRENQHFLNEIASNIPSIIYQFRLRPDGSSHFPYINQRVNAFGISERELAESSEPIFAKIHPDDYAEVQKSITESAQAVSPWNQQFRLWSNSGQYRWHEAKSSPELRPDGSILWHGYLHDIQNLKDIEEKIRYMVVHDGLTGLANRMLLESHVNTEIAHADRNQSNFCLMFLDLDNFKYINDRFGHGTGDRLLQEVAKRLETTLRKSDFVARIGGDEFVILLRSMAQLEGILTIAEKVRLALSEPYDIEGKVMKTSVSIGVSIYPDHGPDLITLERNADAAMYDSKRKGKNMTTIFQSNNRPWNTA